jgi:guanine deaminase
MTDADFMRMAIQTAREGMGKGEMPFGACIVHKGKVLAVAHNSAKADIDTTAHGEVQAIRAANRQLRQLNLPGATSTQRANRARCALPRVFGPTSGESYMPAASRMQPRPGSGRFPFPTTRMKQLSQSDVLITGDVLREDSLKLFDAWSRLPR